MNKEVRAKKFKEMLRGMFGPEWKKECLENGLSELEAEAEIEFHLNKESNSCQYQRNHKPLSVENFSWGRLCVLKETVHCEKLRCHNLTNLAVFLDSEKTGLGDTIRYRCKEHVQEFKLVHVNLGQPTQLQIDTEKTLRLMAQAQAKAWADKHKLPKE